MSAAVPGNVGAVSLLDVNVLIALFSPDHVHHELAHDWFADHFEEGWATCPVTENGFLRVLSNPASGSPVARPVELSTLLTKFCASTHHHFWADSVSLRDTTLFTASLVRGHRQVTDIYLLGLAVKMGGRLVTFDRTIPLSAVADATAASLAVISPVAG